MCCYVSTPLFGVSCHYDNFELKIPLPSTHTQLQKLLWWTLVFFFFFFFKIVCIFVCMLRNFSEENVFSRRDWTCIPFCSRNHCCIWCVLPFSHEKYITVSKALFSFFKERTFSLLSERPISFFVSYLNKVIRQY